MAYPLIILGAGASYDFQKIGRFSGANQYDLNNWRPPLTNNIFDVARFLEIIGNYEHVKPLASAIINITDSDDPFDFEKYLSELEIQFPERSYPQIIALRFYLAELFSNVSNRFYRHTNNHNHLLNEINNRVGKALFVNFNYDTLLEKNIKEINSSKDINSYVSGNIKVIKIHGAHNWRYKPEIDFQKKDVYEFFVSGGQKLYQKYNSQEVYPNIIRDFDYFKEKFSLEAYRERKNNQFDGDSWLYYLPAIAVPIASKAKSVCPPAHIKVLINEIKKVDRILVVGWRAQDKYLLDLMKENLQGLLTLEIISSNKEEATKLIPRFQDIPQVKTNIIVKDYNGYTDFLRKRGYEDFLIASKSL